MNEQQTQEAIRLLHEARMLVHAAKRGVGLTGSNMALAFLANSESFLADSLGEKVHYTHGRSSRPLIAGSTEALERGYAENVPTEWKRTLGVTRPYHGTDPAIAGYDARGNLVYKSIPEGEA